MHTIVRQLNIPNSITLLRLILVPVVVWLLTVGNYDWALWVFIAAALSDALDGFLARVLDQRTELGATLDPIADKLMLLSTLAVLAWLQLIPIWLFGAIIIRDAVIIGGALAYRRRAGHLEVTPTWLGKFHTLLEFAMAALVMADAAVILPLATWLAWLFYLVFFTAVTSGIQYVWLWGRKARML